jgi:hypothetical protein
MDFREPDDERPIDVQPLQHTTWTGHAVRDQRNRRSGTVVDVYFDDGAAIDAPRWLVIDPGAFRRTVVVPARGARCVDDDVIVVPWTREEMRDAPRVAGSGSLTDREEQLLARHYRLDTRLRDIS